MKNVEISNLLTIMSLLLGPASGPLPPAAAAAAAALAVAAAAD